MSLEHIPARAVGSGVKVLRRAQVLERLGISNTTFYALIKTGVLRPGFTLGEHTQARYWLEHDIDQLIFDRAEGAK